MKNLAIGCLLALSTVLPARAENWVDIGHQYHHIFIDVDSIRENGNLRFLRQMDEANNVTYTVSSNVYDCDNRTIQFINVEKYSVATGHLLSSKKFNHTPIPIKVDSVAAAKYRFLCQ
ncbi:MAG: hypothetical protein KME40_08540 [Komarekiella atlantica HA4396-MV6]|jgi:hypothetical protein|nr:hypothetical protein [Komarekiella atlantica HA4396-MV6]